MRTQSYSFHLLARRLSPGIMPGRLREITNVWQFVRTVSGKANIQMLLEKLRLIDICHRNTFFQFIELMVIKYI